MRLLFLTICIYCVYSVTSACRENTGISSSGLQASRLKCEYRVNPLGIEKERPRLSWELESDERGQKQTAYRILVADSERELQRYIGNLWDSGKIISGETNQILYEGVPLGSGKRCVWTVQVWDRDGHPSGWSQPAFWEMALLDPSDWEGDWIRESKLAPDRDEDFYKENPAPLFRKEFYASKKIVQARLYISGLGYYEARINGRRVGDFLLDPGWTAYHKRVLYSTYDVTELLFTGRNCIGVMLGNGWFNPLPLTMWGRLNLREHLPVGNPRFIAQLTIEYMDGTTQVVSTDTSWRAHPGPIIRNNIYLGEVYDARREVEGWDHPGLDTTGWKKVVFASEPIGLLQAQAQPPIKITKEIKPIGIKETQPGIYIFDFGQNFSGWVRLHIQAKAGTRIKLRYGELLREDGSLNPMTSVCGQVKGKNQDGRNIGGPGSPDTAYQKDVYITKGRGEEVYTPHFTFHGFRYVEVTGFPEKPTLETLMGLRLNSAVREVGSFSCSNPLLNKIFEMTRWTFLSNMFSVQSDCPHREKFSYGGDLVVTSDAFILNFDMATFYAKAVRDWHDAALSNGMLTDTAPFVGIQYCGVAWAMAHPHLLWKLVQYYGDRFLLKEQYSTASRWLDLVSSQNPDHIIGEGLSDHEGLESAPSPQMVTPIYYQSARLLARLSVFIGRHHDGEKYTRLAEDIKSAYLKKFLKPGTGKFDPFTQASQAFALYLDLVPIREKQKAIDYLLDKIQKTHNGHLSTGIFGSKFLLEVLSSTGNSNLAYQIVNQKSFPGWGHMVTQGATTLWEHWEFSDNTFSHNHPMFGSVSEWFIRWLAGIQPHPDAVGFDRIVIRPQVVGDLSWAEARYFSIRGEVESRWRREKKMLYLHIEIPPNTTATVYLPSRRASSITESGKPIERVPGIRLLNINKGFTIFEIESGSYEVFSRI